MAPIESLRVDAVEVAHDSEQISFQCSKTEMIVIPHQRIGKNIYSPQPMGLANGIEEGFLVTVVGKRRLSCRAPVHDVIHGSGQLDSQWTRHGLEPAETTITNKL